MEPGRGPPLGEGRGGFGRRRADRARLRRARRVARQLAHAGRRALPVRRGRAASTRTCCAPSTPGWSRACSKASTARRSRRSAEPARRRRALRHRGRDPWRAYLDHASSAPLRPAALGRDATVPARSLGRPRPAARRRARDARRARRRARAGRGVLRGAAARGRVHVVGDRGGEHRDLGCARASGAVRSCGHDRGRALVRARRDRARRGAEVTVVGVDRLGRVRAAEVRRRGTRRHRARVACSSPTTRSARCSRPPRFAAAARERGVLVHVDACAAAGHVPVDFAALGADLCSVTAHKFGGPKGAGALLVRRGLRVPPLLVGGAQERARRGGIENVPAWVGFGAACAAIDVDAEAARQRALIDRAAAGSSSVARRRAVRDRRLAPPPAVPRRRRRRGRTDPARARPARGRRALRLVVLVGDARAVAGARGDGRRRRPLACASRWDGRRRRPTSIASSKCSRESSNGYRGLRPHDSFAGSTTQCSTCATRAGPPRSTARRSASRWSTEFGDGAAVFMRAAGTENHHDLGLFSLGRGGPAARSPGASASTTSRGRSTRSTTSPTCASGSSRWARSSARATTA